jgi:hypothetical protein
MNEVFINDLTNSEKITIQKSDDFLNWIARFRLMIFTLYKPLL